MYPVMSLCQYLQNVSTCLDVRSHALAPVSGDLNSKGSVRMSDVPGKASSELSKSLVNHALKIHSLSHPIAAQVYIFFLFHGSYELAI